MTKKYKTGFLIYSLVLVLSLSMLSAMGVANSYWEDKPLKLAPGESTTISLRLQNENTESTTVESSITGAFATLVDGPRYVIPPDKESFPVYINVEIPEDATIGTDYNIFVSFKQVGTGDQGMLTLSQGITAKVPLEVVGETDSELYGQVVPEKSNNGLFVVLGILILAVIVVALYVKRKGRS